MTEEGRGGRSGRCRRPVVVAVVAMLLGVVLAPVVVSTAGVGAAGIPAGPVGGRPAGPIAEGVNGLPDARPGGAAGESSDATQGVEATLVVEVLPTGGTAAVSAAVVSVGGERRGEVVDELVLAAVPAGALDVLLADPAVRGIRRPVRSAPLRDLLSPSGPHDPSFLTGPGGTSEEVGKTGVGAWTAAGHRGQGQKVAIIDSFDSDIWTRAASYGAVPVASATYCQHQGSACSVWDGQSAHGVAVAEIIHDQAPDAALYLVSVTTASDYAAALAWLDARGVSIVNHSQTAQYDGPGNGTGPMAAVVDDAVSRGMLWVQAGGNAAGTARDLGDYWRGPFTDSNLNGYHEFAPGDEVLSLDCSFINGVRWSDWGEAGITDYDVLLVSMPDQTVLSTSARSHGDGAAVEWPEPACAPGQWVGLIIYRYSAGAPEASPDTIEVLTNGGLLERWSNPYSASGPFSDSANPGLVSVGAIDPATGTTAGSYSSWGPTNDGRRKPDVAAASCVTSLSMVLVGLRCFNGTSAAAPAVAGTAAAVRSSGVAITPPGLAAFLLGNTVDRGGPGPDNVYGQGEVVLGPPPVPGVVNDDLDDAWPVRPGSYLSLTGAADHEPGEPQHGGTGARSVWFRFTAPWDGVLSLRTEGSAFDTLLGVYTGDGYALTPIASDDDGGGGTSSRVDVPVVEGITYRIAVDGAGASFGLAHLSVSLSGVCPIPFPDVTSTHPFCAAVAWASGTGVATGYADGNYRPGNAVSRQAMVAFLRRMAGSPPVPVGAPTFRDVSASSPFYDDIRWAAGTGVTTGYVDGTFQPGRPVSRQAMAAFLYRLSGQPPLPPVAPTFRDVDVHHPFASQIRWLAGTGVASGYSDATYKPASPVTRQAMASFLWLWAGR